MPDHFRISCNRGGAVGSLLGGSDSSALGLRAWSMPMRMGRNRSPARTRAGDAAGSGKACGAPHATRGMLADATRPSCGTRWRPTWLAKPPCKPPRATGMRWWRRRALESTCGCQHATGSWRVLQWVPGYATARAGCADWAEASRPAWGTWGGSRPPRSSFLPPSQRRAPAQGAPPEGDTMSPAPSGGSAAAPRRRSQDPG